MHTLSRRIAIASLAAMMAALSHQAFAQPVTATPSGLKIIDVKVGTGPSPRTGQTVTVNYTGWLYVGGKKGDKFDSRSMRASRSRFRSATIR